MQRTVLLSCLVFSGAAGLSYEILWVRLLALSFGTTTLSFSTVLAVFFGGLALGSWLVTRFLPRIERPLVAYALIELCMGILGLVLHPILTRLGPLFALVDPGPGLSGAMVRLLFAAPLLLLPTILMGATLPLISKAVVRLDGDVGRGTSLLYAANTLGACLGAYFVTYHLLYLSGVWGAHVATAATNGLVAAVAFTLARRSARSEPTAAQPTPKPAVDPTHAKLIVTAGLLTFLSGFSFICFEVVWARLFSVFLHGTIYGVGAVLICFLFGIALGSLAISGSSDRVDAPRWFTGLQCVTSVGVVLVTVLLPRVRYELEVVSRSVGSPIVSLHLQLAIVFVTLLVPTAAAGASFPLLVRSVTTLARDTGRNLGLIYAVNTAGTILGSLLTGFFIIPELGSEAALYLGLLLASATAALSAVLLIRSSRTSTRLAIAGLVLLPLLLFPGLDLPRLVTAGSTELNFEGFRSSIESALPKLKRLREGQAAVVEVIETGPGSVGLSLNGLGQGTIHQVPPNYPLESVLLATVPLSHRPNPSHVLIIGFGAGATVQVMAGLELPSVTVIELEPEVLASADLLFAGRSPLDNPRVHAHVGDARHFLLVNGVREQRMYDVITSMPSHPWVAASIFTREFFQLARDNLSEDGVFVTWFGTGQMDTTAVESMVRAFAEVFAHFSLYHVREASALYIVGSKTPLRFDPEAAAALAQNSQVGSHSLLRSPLFLPARLVVSSWVPGSHPGKGPVNSDDSAFVELHSPRSSTHTVVLSDLARVRLLPEQAIVSPSREFYLDLLEETLGTPSGELPRHNRRPQLDPARVAQGPEFTLLSEPDRAYLSGRVAMLEGRMQDALTLFGKAGGAAEPTATRASKFRLYATPRSVHHQRAEWARIPLTDDVALFLMDADPELARERLRTTLTSSGAVWLLRVFEGLEVEPTSAAAQSKVRSLVRSELLGSRHLEPLERCVEFARTHRLEDLAGVCAAETQRIRGERATRLLEQGSRRLAGRQTRAALVSLRAAYALAPHRQDILVPLLVAQTEAGDVHSFEAIRNISRLAFTPEVFEVLWRRAQEGRAGLLPR